MNDKTCGECRYLDKNRYCNFLDFEPKPQMKGCANFEPKPTNGDVIRQGGNKRLITFSTEWSCFHCAYHNGIERKCERPEGKDCFDGIEAWLNAPAKEREDE